VIGKTISHYKVLEKLGEGGMGVVYKAEDTRLRRPVALKFLKHEAVGDSVEKKRFLHEAQAAARLDHPNICSVYEVDHIVGQSFIAMAYVDGQSLKDKIEAGPLEIEEVIGIAHQIAEGLNEAHEKGIVHRDIKPGNIMLTTKGQVKIMDFGLAKLSGMTRVTKTGSTIGTMAYMSPEQARGEEVGRSTDIWSFGVVLYEMLTRRLPFQGEYEAAVMYSILNRELDPVSTLRPDTPRNLQRIIGKSLEKEPADRYQSMTEIITDLKETKPAKNSEPEPKKSIIVLPFEDISPEGDNEYFSDGLTEEIITDLSHVSDLLVISRNSAMTFKGTKKKTKEIARDVNVRYVLEGSVRKAGNNLRITAQLIDAKTDAHMWAEKYRGTLDDVFDIQEEVSGNIVDALKVELSPEENKRITERPIDNINAYELHLRAQYEMYLTTKEKLNHALQLIMNGLNMIGDNEILLADLGLYYSTYYEFVSKEDKTFNDKARECVDKIFTLNPESANGHFLKGRVHIMDGDIQLAANEFKRAIESNPNDLNSLLRLGWVYAQTGNVSAGRPLVNRLLMIDPLTPVNHMIAGALEWMEGNFDAGLKHIKKSHELESSIPIFRYWYAKALAYNGQIEEAYSLLTLVEEDTPGNIFAWLGTFFRYAHQGNKTKALESVTEEFKTTAREDEIYPIWMAESYSLIDEKKEAIDWIEHVVDFGFINYHFLNEYDPFLDDIRSEPRFKKLMERVNYLSEHFEV